MSKDLLAFLSLPATSQDPNLAVDALVEYIQGKRRNGQSFYEIMVILMEVMQKVPPSLDPYFDLARSICHIPPLVDLSPTPKSPFIQKTSPQILLQRIISTLSRYSPELGGSSEITLEHARESLLEWSLGVEAKIMEGGYGEKSGGKSAGRGGGEDLGNAGVVLEGRGGAGTIGSAGFDEIESRFEDIVVALPNPSPQILALLLSLRLSLSYLSLPQLLTQLTLHLSLPECESVLRQWVKRRLPGEGRCWISERLDWLQRVGGDKRRALIGVIRVVRVKFLLPSGMDGEEEEGGVSRQDSGRGLALARRQLWRIPLPAPGKTKVITMLTQFASSGVASGPMSPTSPTGSATSPTKYSSGGSSSRLPPSYFTNPTVGTSPTASPNQPQNNAKEQNLSSYAIELLSEWLTREKREYMRAEKWIKSGRKTLSKELNEVEEKLCGGSAGGLGGHGGIGVSGSIGGAGGKRKGKELASPGGMGGGESIPNGGLLPVFALMRRIYNLDSSGSVFGTLSPSLASKYPAIPIPDELEPYYPPTHQSVTSSLYCNPRLSIPAAVLKLMELIEYEKDLRIQNALMTVHMSRRSSLGRPSGEGEEREAERTEEENELREVAWGVIEKTKMGKVLEYIARRFPDGEYSEAFKIVALQADCPPQLHRAPSYRSIASTTTAERTASYLKGATSHRGSASISLLNSNGRQGIPFQSFTMAGGSGSGSGSGSPSPVHMPIRRESPEPLSLASAEALALPGPPPMRPFAHTRANSLPSTQPSLRNLTLPTLSIPSLSSLISDAVLERNTLAPDRDLIISPTSTEGDVDFEAIYAGYGDAIQPLTPDAASPAPFAWTTPVAVTRTPASPSRSHSDESVLVTHRSPSQRNPIYPRPDSPRINSSPAQLPPATPVSVLRTGTVIMPRRANAPLTPVANNDPLPRPGHSRQTPSLSPTSWRQEFMSSNVLLRPAPRQSPSSGSR